MAVVIASALDKDMAGSPLFRGVSFKLERGDRMTLAGSNGAGKTTLLRMVSGETGDRRRRARLREGHARGAPRPAPAARARPDPARLRAVRVPLPGDARGGPAPARGRDGGAPRRRRPARPLLARPGQARARGRLGLAQPCARARCTGSASRTSSSTGACRPSRAASSHAPRSRGRSPATPTCCSSTSPPTTSTSPRSSGSRTTWWASTPR